MVQQGLEGLFFLHLVLLVGENSHGVGSMEVLTQTPHQVLHLLFVSLHLIWTVTLLHSLMTTLTYLIGGVNIS